MEKENKHTIEQERIKEWKKEQERFLIKNYQGSRPLYMLIIAALFFLFAIISYTVIKGTEKLPILSFICLSGFIPQIGIYLYNRGKLRSIKGSKDKKVQGK